MNKLSFTTLGNLSKPNIAELQIVFKKLNTVISPVEIKNRMLGPSTGAAIKQIQKQSRLPVTGILDTQTLNIINENLFDAFYANNKLRTQKLNQLLVKAGIPVEGANLKQPAGAATRNAVKTFQKQYGLIADGKITPALVQTLQETVIAKTYTTKTQIGRLQAMLKRASKITKLNYSIPTEELNSKLIGTGTEDAIRAVQTKYKLTVTGQPDQATLDKLLSISVSKGSVIPVINKPSIHELETITSPLRLNLKNAKVASLQKMLAYLGYNINKQEFATQTYGKSTFSAVAAYQQSKGLSPIGHAEIKTLHYINKDIIQALPDAALTEYKYRVRGSVRDELFDRQGNMVIKVYEKLLTGESEQPLITKKNHLSGFFDITYNPPIDPVTKQPKDKFHLVIKLFKPADNNPANDVLVSTQLHYNVPRIHWANFNLNNQTYRGNSDYTITFNKVNKAISGSDITSLQETDDNKQVTQLSRETGLSTDTLMRLILSHLVAKSVNQQDVLTPEVFYSFIRQNIPSSLPGDLLLGSGNWETVDQLVELAANGIAFLPDNLQQEAIKNAILHNFVSQKVQVGQAAILTALSQLRTTFTLQKPILTGNGTLQSILNLVQATKGNQVQATIANTFVSSKGINNTFWANLNVSPAIAADLKKVIQLGNITKNHVPIMSYFKDMIAGGKIINSPGGLATFDEQTLVSYIKKAPAKYGKVVPDNIPGATEAEKVANYANVLKARAAYIYPAIATVANLKNAKSTVLTNLNDIAKFFNSHPDVDFRTENIDQYIAKNNINVNDVTRAGIKTVQRINKLTKSAFTASTIIRQGLQNSSQIYFTGKDRLVSQLAASGVAVTDATKAYEAAKMQYTQIMARFIEFSPEFSLGTPQVISSPNYTPDEIKAALGDIPNIETLFGSTDYCDCVDCKSLLGPAAYFTDLLRFLKEHDSLIPNGNGSTFLSVKDILIQRRPDLVNIKLNCDNTNTPLPYIDLVCEILENLVSPAQSNFSYQTTLSQDELAAIPQYIRPEAYSTIAVANYPISSSFNLWQEEARTYLNYLMVPRYKLMEAFQKAGPLKTLVPDDPTIAAEFFSISSHEKKIITTANLTGQANYWGNGNTASSMPVAVFMNKTNLSYNDVLSLLLVKFVNDPSQPNPSAINSPVNSCDTSVQTINNLSPARYDIINRFLRLWRKTNWQMWELDLLLRNQLIGGNQLSVISLENLYVFSVLQSEFSLSTEVLLTFFGDINSENHAQPGNPGTIIPSLYQQLFQNPVITSTIDAHFALNTAIPPKLINETLPINTTTGYTPLPVILSALAINQSDFDSLVQLTDGKLSMASLSILYRYVTLANALGLSIQDLLILLSVVNPLISDPFKTVATVGTLLDVLSIINESGLSLLQLDYVINYIQASPVGLRDQVFIQMVTDLQTMLIVVKASIDQLNLAPADQQLIINFNAAGLSSLSLANIVATLNPLQTVLTARLPDFKTAGFSVQQAQSVIQFDPTDTSADNLPNLVTTITTMQQNLIVLLNQSSTQIKAQVSSSFSLNDQQADILLNQLKQGTPSSPLLSILSGSNLIQQDANGNYTAVTAANFPGQFNAYLLLHKTSLLIQQMQIDEETLSWFITNYVEVKTLDFSALPVAALTGNTVFLGWLNLSKFLQFKAAYPEPEDVSLLTILKLAINRSPLVKAVLFTQINTLTQWSIDDLTAMDKAFGLQQSRLKADYLNPDTYIRFQLCFSQMNNTGVSATTMINWALKNDNTNQDMGVATQTRQAIKSKYQQDDWLQKIAPIYNSIREKKRDALIAFHTENSMRTQQPTIILNGNTIPNPEYWKNADALYNYLLIDVQMGAVQLTSRIKQAISSVQLFVQRCFLNLENRYVQVSMTDKEDTASPNAWSQWQWMKSNVLWIANRQIFFYPENWLEPKLRDDKSTFFNDFENALQQGDLTSDNAEQAFEDFLHSIDEVAHLEVCGLYHEMEDLNDQIVGYEINIVHVIARTKGTPAVYYYRKYDVNYTLWSGWEKIDADISGDHVVPVIYNRKLHLFWLEFIEKPIKVQKLPAAQLSQSAGPSDSPDAPKQIEVQIGWTLKKSSGWAAKKISRQKLIHPWERPYFSYLLKPYYNATLNELNLDIYLSTSQEFNGTKFYDPFSGNKVFLTQTQFNETFFPWHSSAFIFDGDVREVKMKALNGQYPSSPSDSYDYVYANFGEDARNIEELQPIETGPRLQLPGGMHYSYNYLTNNVVNSPNPSHLRVLENGKTISLLDATSSTFKMVVTQQDLQLDTIATDHPFFYQDGQRAMFIQPQWEQILNNYGQVTQNLRQYYVTPFYHPYTVLFIRELNAYGVDGLFKRNVQSTPQNFNPVNNFNFNSYQPENSVVADQSIQTDVVDFSQSGAFSLYNWELFFHAPLMIASKLSQNQRFEEAMNWFHYIFDPTNIDSYPTPQRYWITQPFFDYNSDDYRSQRIQDILANLDINKGQLNAWRNNPFDPFVIARYRPVAFQKNVVMKYIDNLIAWGDQLFGQDTIEAINQATLLYMLAYEILGDRPQKVPGAGSADKTFSEIESELDEFGNATVDVLIEDTLLPIDVVPAIGDVQPMPKLQTSYFCIPNNDTILSYWDTVADRLYKIRHSMNLQGIVRQLPLFDPPIDPALLVKAAAAGVDLSSVLTDINSPIPYYRFRVVVQKAIEFCNNVKALGENLLQVLEKNDAEGLSLLRSQQEIQVNQAIKDVKQKQLDEATESINASQKALDMANEKIAYYSSRATISDLENAALKLSSDAATMMNAVAAGNVLAAALVLLPEVTIGASGFGGSPIATVSDPLGMSLSGAARIALDAISAYAGAKERTAGMTNTLASYQRRKDEWGFQNDLAKTEAEQAQSQILSAQIRQAIAQLDLNNQDTQINNSKAVYDYLQNKYTNTQLYSWMITQVSNIYFQAYQLAYDMAKKAKRSYQYELGIQSSSYIQFGYWDSLKKGLYAGDKLLQDLQRLDGAYLDQCVRELEITKHVSLAQMFPVILLTLQTTGQCVLPLPEWLFDMDYCGHYMRRIKSVSISIPCVVGPYTNINCTLSLLKSQVRTSMIAGSSYNDGLTTSYGSISSIATSHAQNDSGMFELNFKDDRYLPFEGSGAISNWAINMPISNNYFDFSTLTDVILHINYTARDGGGLLQQAALNNLKAILPNSAARLFSLKHDFPNEWYKFLNPLPGGDQWLIFDIKTTHFPFFIQSQINSLTIKQFELVPDTTVTTNFLIDVTFSAIINGNTASTAYPDDITVTPGQAPGILDASSLTNGPAKATSTVNMQVKLSTAGDFKSLTTDQIDDLYFIVQIGK